MRTTLGFGHGSDLSRTIRLEWEFNRSGLWYNAMREVGQTIAETPADKAGRLWGKSGLHGAESRLKGGRAAPRYFHPNLPVIGQ